MQICKYNSDRKKPTLQVSELEAESGRDGNHSKKKGNDEKISLYNYLDYYFLIIQNVNETRCLVLRNRNSQSS